MADEGDELRMLQARAYGPDADIHGDADASARLRMLERVPEVPDDEAPVPEPVVEDASEPTALPVVRARRSIRIPVLWAVSLVATALVAFGVARFATGYARFHPLVPQATQAAVLAPNAAVPVPKFVTGGSSVVEFTAYDDFLGLRTIVSDEGSPVVAGEDRCLWMVSVADAVESDAEDTTNGYSVDGPVLWGCAAGGFPATVSFTVSEQFPDELRAEYELGTGLELVLDEQDDAVIVFVDR